MSMRVGDESGRARAEAIDPALLAPDPVATPQDGSEWRAAWRRFRRHPLAMIGLGFLVFMFLACFVGVHFAQDPNHAAPARADRRVRRRRTGSAPTS